MSVEALPHLDPNNRQTSLPRLFLRILLLAAIIFALVRFFSPDWVKVSNWALLDNDDAMRVLEVRDWLGGQGWFDLKQHRLNPPQGGDMHWSRIADLPLATLMTIFNMIFGVALGEKLAVFLTPPLLGAVYVWISVKAALSLGGKNALLPALFFSACAPAALSYFTPGRVDHHGLQIIFLTTALWGLIRGTTQSSTLAGIALAMGIGIGLEALPLQIVLIGWVAGRWALRGEAVKVNTQMFALGFAISLGVIFVATVPYQKWNLPTNDAIGRGYVVLGVVGGVLLAGAASLRIGKILYRFFALICVSIVVLAGVLIFPEVLVPPYGHVDPLLRELWLNNVHETIPLRKSKISAVLTFAVFPLSAGIAAIAAVYWAKNEERDLWVLAVLAIFVSVGLAIFWQNRVSGMSAAVSSLMAAALLGRIYNLAGLRAAIITAIALNPILPSFAAMQIAKQFEAKPKNYKTGGGSGCFGASTFAELAKKPASLVVAPIDMGARILLTTQHSVLAAPYHRNNSGNLASYQIFLASPDRARVMISLKQIAYVAICKKSAENINLGRYAPDGLMAHLANGRTPKWLVQLPSPKGSDVIAFKVNLD